MKQLNSLKDIRQVDAENVIGSVEALPDQCQHAWEEANKVNVPDSYKKVKNVIMAGMGGSGLGARVIESVYFHELPVPLIRVNNYHLPPYVNHDSLVVCSSYSGTTEEVVEIAKQAIAKKAKWLAIGKGGTVIDMAKDSGVPFYQIEAKYNPSNQPRMSVGYSIIGQLVLGAKAGLFKLSHSDIKTAVEAMKAVQAINGVSVNGPQNQAKTLAYQLVGKILLLIAAEHLVGPLHISNNQFNENTKTLTADYEIPELNHHLMEGLIHPPQNKDNVFTIFANSNLYPKRIRQRIKITQDVVGKNHIPSFMFEAKASTKLAQAFEVIQFGSYTNTYLAVLYDQNAAPIPWVDYFKTKLGQPLGK